MVRLRPKASATSLTGRRSPRLLDLRWECWRLVSASSSIKRAITHRSAFPSCSLPANHKRYSMIGNIQVDKNIRKSLEIGRRDAQVLYKRLSGLSPWRGGNAQVRGQAWSNIRSSGFPFLDKTCPVKEIDWIDRARKTDVLGSGPCRSLLNQIGMS
jgi:hypothetical protein